MGFRNRRPGTRALELPRRAGDPVGNPPTPAVRPTAPEDSTFGPIANRPQITNLPHNSRMTSALSEQPYFRDARRVKLAKAKALLALR
jgi:hypothetical protein